jgi:hypothetical protein
MLVVEYCISYFIVVSSHEICDAFIRKTRNFQIMEESSSFFPVFQFYYDNFHAFNELDLPTSEIYDYNREKLRKILPPGCDAACFPELLQKWIDFQITEVQDLLLLIYNDRIKNNGSISLAKDTASTAVLTAKSNYASAVIAKKTINPSHFSSSIPHTQHSPSFSSNISESDFRKELLEKKKNVGKFPSTTVTPWLMQNKESPDKSSSLMPQRIEQNGEGSADFTNSLLSFDTVMVGVEKLGKLYSYLVVTQEISFQDFFISFTRILNLDVVGLKQTPFSYLSQKLKFSYFLSYEIIKIFTEVTVFSLQHVFRVLGPVILKSFLSYIFIKEAPKLVTLFTEIIEAVENDFSSVSSLSTINKTQNFGAHSTSGVHGIQFFVKQYNQAEDSRLEQKTRVFCVLYFLLIYFNSV